MSDTLTKAREADARWRDAVDRARAEVARRQAAGRETKALARARAGLERAEGFATKAAERLATLERKAAEAEARKERMRASVDPAFIRRLDRVAAQAPAVMDRWKRERAAEPAAIAKRKKALRLRTTVDIRAAKAAPASAPQPTAEQPAAIQPAPEPAPIKPPREGLLPGEFKVLGMGQLIEAPRRPLRWTPAHVGARLVEAHDVLRRMPMTIRPKEFGKAWPAYVYEAADITAQAEGGPIAGGRFRFSTSADEIARMNEALGWLLEFQNSAPALNGWAYGAANRKRIDGLISEDPPKALIPDLKIIADALNARGVAVR